MNEEVVLSLLASVVNSGYGRGVRCLSEVFFALLTYWHLQFTKIFTLQNRHRIFWELIFGPGIFLGFSGSPRDFFGS